jgi:Phosphatidylinositol-glycan biosynthesis class S protein.
MQRLFKLTSDGTPEAEEESPFRDPSQLFFQGDYTRRSILASYWIVIILALPLWWHTTSIERLSLPSSRVYAQAEKDLRFPVKIQFDTQFSMKNGPSFAIQLQELLDERIFRGPQKWRGIDIHVSGDRHAGGSISITKGYFLIDWTFFEKTTSMAQAPTSSPLPVGKYQCKTVV